MSTQESAAPPAPSMLMSLQEAIHELTRPGAEFEVGTETIRGVETRVWGGCASSLREVLERHKDLARDFLVYVDEHGEDHRLTYPEHYRACCRLADSLVRDFGIRKGDRIALAARNLPEWSVVFWAVTGIGAIVVPLNAWWTGPEMVYGLNDSGSRMLFADSERLERLQPHRGEVEGVEKLVGLRVARDPAGSGASDVLRLEELIGAAAEDVAFPEVALHPDDDATIFYTSGTTGFPKGALGTHRNVCSNLRAAEFLKRRGEVRTGIVAAPIEDLESPQPATLLSVPMFHVTGCHSTLVPALGGGSKLVITYKFDAAQTVELIEREKVSGFGGVPTLVWKVLEAPNFRDHDLSSVVRVAYGGAPAAPELVRRIQEEFPQAAPSNGYGLTETSAITSTNAGPEYVAKPDSAGLPVPPCSVKVCDEAGTELPTGAIGELWIHGPNVIKGYWNKPEATAETFVDGWLRSGDLARLDDEGFITICDRAKDMVIRGGENVYCSEVEAALHEHPQVLAAAVYGVADRVLGEEVAVTLQMRRGASVEAAELRAFALERLAGFKVPVEWELGTEPLPLNANGKIIKRELREAAEARRAG